MRFSVFAGTTVVPTLARVVLAAAFITVGYQKVGTSTDFTPEQCAILASHGVTPEGPDNVAAADAAPVADEAIQAEDGVDEAAAVDDATAEGETTDAEATEVEGDDASAAVEEAVEVATDELPVTRADGLYPEDFPNGGRARTLHKITLLCHDAGWNEYRPALLAWVAAITEFLGGVMILIGLLTRIWSLGLATAMGVAFYLTSIRLSGFGTDVDLLTYAGDIPQFNQTYIQLAFFVLAFGLLLTGPGPLSADRMLFGRPAPKKPVAPDPPAPRRMQRDPVEATPRPSEPVAPAPEVEAEEEPSPEQSARHMRPDMTPRDPGSQ